MASYHPSSARSYSGRSPSIAGLDYPMPYDISYLKRSASSEDVPRKMSASPPPCIPSTFTGPAQRHRHAEKSDAALRQLLALFADDPDSPDTQWRSAGERGGTRISIYNDSPPCTGGLLPIVRGDGILDGGFAPREVIAVINSLGARKLCK
jgi:hypothetical protein